MISTKTSHTVNIRMPWRMYAEVEGVWQRIKLSKSTPRISKSEVIRLCIERGITSFTQEFDELEGRTK